MIDFAPTEDQTAIRDLARQVATEQFRKHARAAEEAGEMPTAVRKVLAETGLLTPFPEDFGGSGVQDAVTHALITEELAFGDGGLAMNVVGSILAPLAVLVAGNEDQRKEFLGLFSQDGETPGVGAVGLAELATGFNLRETSNVLQSLGGSMWLDVQQRGVVHGINSTLRIVLAKLYNAPDGEGLCLVALPGNLEEWEVTAEAHPLGLVAAPRARWKLYVELNSVWVLGGLEQGGPGAARFVALANVLLGALAVGIARAALEYSCDYAKGRIQFGKPISSYQAIAFMAAEMAMDVDAARFLIWRAAQTWDTGGDALRLAERARMQAVKTAQRVTTDAVQILGGAGFLQDHPVELWMRDAAALAALG
ncbi:MAG TPA: acyl-CoA dehydrogenase family protein [Ktedonobacterales bacterium]|jgi:alkylation response protein AidB-like acyl-CoA dehydrogenase